MNRFWGRNDHGAGPKFSRDDEQILALNYENLCDSDYLNRLFVSDTLSSGDDGVVSSEQHQGQVQDSHHEQVLYTSDISEDLIIYGNSVDLGRLFFEKRFFRELLVKNQDAITNLVNRQVVVFEHTGKLMIDRCVAPWKVPPKIPPSIAASANAASSMFHMATGMLSSTVKLFDKRDFSTVKQTSLESLIAAMFQVLFCDSRAQDIQKGKDDVPTESLPVNRSADWPSDLIYGLRTTFNKGLTRCFSISFEESAYKNSVERRLTVENNLKISLTCFYGLLGLALYTRDSSEVLLAVSHLTTILVYAEEWQEIYLRDLKAQNVMRNVATPPVAVTASSLQSSAGASATKIAIKPTSRDNERSKASKQKPSSSSTAPATTATVLGNSGSGSSEPASGLKGSHDFDDRHEHQNTSTLVCPPSPLLHASPSGSFNTANSNEPNSAVVVNTNSLKSSGPIPVPSNGVNTSKTWESKQTSKNEKDAMSKSKIQQVKANGKQLSGEANKLYNSEIEIINNMIAATAGNNNVIVNNVAVTYNNQVSAGLGNNNQPDDERLSEEYNVKQRHSFVGATSKNNEELNEKYKRDVREFKDSLEAMLKIPKPIVKLIYECCSGYSASTSGGGVLSSPNGPKDGTHGSGTKPNGTIAALGSSSSHLPIAATASSNGSSYVWSSGQNSYGELGVGDVNMRKTFAKVTSLDDKSIVSIGAGNEHSLFVSKEGKLYTAGYNDNGQCGTGNVQQVRQPTLLTTLEGEEIAQVHVYNGCEHTLAVTRDGKLFAFGYNYRGQLGLGNTNSETTPRPVRGLLSRKVVLAACSYHHSVILCSDGCVFSCGRNDSGQLGHGDLIDKKTPQVVLNCPRGVNSISCGQFHTIASTSSGSAYACGKNDYGQLGLESTSNVKSFTKIINIPPEIEQIIQVCCGYYHTLILSNTAVVAGFGRNDYGQLGLGHSQAKVFQCTIISSLRDKGVTTVSAGCYHSVVVTSNGMLYVFGRNNHGQLATGDQEERHAPHPVDDFVGQNIVSVAAGFYHTLVLISDSVPLGVDGFLTPRGMRAKIGTPSGALEAALDPSSALSTSVKPVGLLLKDVTQLTGIQSPAKSNKVPDASLQSRSKTSNRDLLVFLMNHVESIIQFSVKSPIDSEAHERLSNQTLVSVLCNVITLLEVFRRVVDDYQGHLKLAVSHVDALGFIHKVIKMVGTFLKINRLALLNLIAETEKAKESWEVNSPVDDFKAMDKQSFLSQSMVVSEVIKDIYELCHRSAEVVPIEALVMHNVVLLRQELLMMYFSASSVEEEQKNKYQEVIVDISVCITKCYEVLFPNPAHASAFMTIMKENILSLSGISTAPPPAIKPLTRIGSNNSMDVRSMHQLTLNLRLMTTFCSVFRNNDEVVRLFQRSKYNGLVIFRHTLSLYGHFSRLSLEKRLSHSSNAHSVDVRRVVTSLEHCIANIIKCAVPVVFASSLCDGSERKDHQSLLFAFGVQIIKEVLADAESVIDFLLLQQPLTEDVLCQLRYGTVMPSILPSILIYGIAFTKFGCSMLDIIPQLKVLIRKLQQVGKAEYVHVFASKNSLDKKASTASLASEGAEAGKDIETWTQTGESMAEEIFSQRKDSSTSWWFRLLKLCIQLVGKMGTEMVFANTRPDDLISSNAMLVNESLSLKDNLAAVVTHPAASNLILPNKFSDLCHLPLWKFVGQSTSTKRAMRLTASETVALLTRDLDDSPCTPMVIELCKALRSKEKTSDLMYKMLSQSSQSMPANALLCYIEECLVETVSCVIGFPAASVHATYFKGIARFTKHLHSKRSTLVTYNTDISWTQILMILCNVVRLVCTIVVEGWHQLRLAAPIPLPNVTGRKGNAWMAFRRALMVIVCMSRWRTCVRLRMKNIAHDVVDFVFRAASSVTDSFCLVSTEVLSEQIVSMMQTMLAVDSSVVRCSQGLDVVIGLLEDIASMSMKADVIFGLTVTLKEKLEKEELTHQERPIVCCSKEAMTVRDQSISNMIQYLVKLVSQFESANGACNFSQHELLMIVHCMKLLQLIESRIAPYRDCAAFNRQPSISMKTLSNLLIQIAEKKKLTINAPVSNEKANRRGITQRERNAAFRRATNSIVSYIEAVALSESRVTLDCRPYMCTNLFYHVVRVLNHFLDSKNESLRQEALEDDSIRQTAKDTGKEGLLGNLSSVLIKNSKDANSKKKYQDLITKPMEFCRTVEGFVVQGDKLLNNYKGVDFSIATWILVAKKSTAKYSFICGKVSHNDVWPLIMLRHDGKLELQFGQNNSEFEKLVSDSTIPHNVWTHIAVAVESKKIKIFINGILDGQASPKINNRAVMYPLIVGCSPLSVRTRVSFVRDGFDGMLAQFKYYSRALSPIHVRAIFDNGPPETIDISERLSYELLACLKSILMSGAINSQYFEQYLTSAADLMQKLFVTTECSRRLRFAALDLLGEILKQNTVQDLTLSSKLMANSGYVSTTVSVMQCKFLPALSSFRERMAVFFIRLVGASWAPHFYTYVVEECNSTLDLLKTVAGSNENAQEELEAQQKLHGTATEMSQFLNFVPCLLNSQEMINSTFAFGVSSPSSMNNSMVDKMVSNELLRGEVCSRVMKVLNGLAKASDDWAEAIVSVIRGILSQSAIHFASHEELDCLQKVDMIGAVMVLCGGATGPHLGASVKSFFGDSVSTILSVNKTTNTATVLTLNAAKTSRQITKVRLFDLKIDESKDKLPVHCFSSSLMGTLVADVIASLNALGDYVPLLLSDMFSTFRPDHILQSKSLLRCMRPVEQFVFCQLLQFLTELKAPIAPEMMPLHSMLYSVIQQAAVATLRLEDYEDELITDIPNTFHIWNRCANYILALPSKLVRQNVYTTANDDKIVFDFIQKHLGVNIDTIIDTPYEKLLTQGRLCELIQYISVDSYASSSMDELLQVVGFEASAPAAVPMSGHQPVVDRKYLISDWASSASIYSQWPSLINNYNNINETDYINILRLIYVLRKSIVLSSRAFLSQASRFCQTALDSHSVSSKMLVWQSSLPLHSNSYLQEPDSQNAFYHLLQSPSVTWTLICEYLWKNDCIAVTLSIAYTLRYAVSILQEHLSSTETNILVTSDLFRRSLQTMFYWLRYNEDKANSEEVYYHVLKIMLCKLSHVVNEEVQVQLVTVCVSAVKRLCVSIFSGYKPTSELLDLIRGHNFALLRAMAQIHVIRHKSHNLSNVSPMAYMMTQLVSGLEIIQRHGSVSEFESLQFASSEPKEINSNLIKQYNALVTAKMQHTETTPPKVVGTRSTSVDLDLTLCSLSAANLLKQLQETAVAGSALVAPSNGHQWQNVTVEVAISTGSSSPADSFFETVYCGTSTKFCHSDLIPDTSYVVKCRAYYGSVPLNWSPTVEFRTEKGILFTFDRMKCGPEISLSSDCLCAAYQGEDTWSTMLGTRSFSSGVTSWEIRVTKSSTAYIFVGVATSSADLNTFLGGCSEGWGFIGEQALYHNREKVKIYGEAFSSGDIIGVTLDLNQGTLSFSRNHKNLGVAFDKIVGELYPAVAFYNMEQMLEIMPNGFKTTCPFEPIPISPSRLNLDEISLLNELVFCLHYRHPLSHRLLVLVTEHCNQWSTSLYARHRAVSGKDIFVAKESPLLKRFGLSVGERVRTTYGVAEVVGSAFNKIWFKVNPAGEVWFFSNQQIVEGRNKKLFLRCSYDNEGAPSNITAAALGIKSNRSADNLTAMPGAVTSATSMFDIATIQELIDPAKWSEEMDNVLLSFLASQSESSSSSKNSLWGVTSAQVCENFRTLQQQLSRLMLSSNDLSHRWGISGPKRKAVLARIGLLRLLNQMLDMYLPFMISNNASNPFACDTPTSSDEFNPMVLTLTGDSLEPSVVPATSVTSDAASGTSGKYPFVTFSWLPTSPEKDVVHVGPLHAIRRRVFPQLKLAHFWEMLNKSATRPSKTEDDYDYPDDLPHVKINRLKSFRAREASELMKIPGEDFLLSSMFCQLWRELRQYPSTKLRISYTHPMDDGQSRTFKIKFDGEGVDDYGGPYREIFQQVCEELQRSDPSLNQGEEKRPSSWVSGEAKQLSSESTGFGSPNRNAKPEKPIATRCFLPILIPTLNWTTDIDCKERYRYTLNPASTSLLKMDLYHFLGQLVGIAIRSKITLDLALPSLIWKCVVNERLCDADLASIDATAYDFIQRLSGIYKQLHSKQYTTPEEIAVMETLHVQAYDLIADLPWTATRTDGTVVELIEGGANKMVQFSEIGRYLELYVECRLSESKMATDMFRSGLISIIPESVISLLSWEEMQNIACGLRVIDIQRLRENTEYDDDISADDEHILNFWDVLTEFSEEEKSTFLKFVWARPTLPPKGVEFSQKMRVLSAVGDDANLKPDQYLPKAHTCFFSINLPKYSTKQLMAEKLRYAIYNCTEMDADFRTTETEIVGWGASSSSSAAQGDWQNLSLNGESS